MANLLERASIVLTPTGFNNGEALCVKPDDGSGDFDFSRNSAATRVNSQGLVEDVQILSSNLVQNGDFSDGSANWTLGSQWSIGTNKAIYDNSGNGNLSQNFTWQVGKKYKITFDIGDFTTSHRFDIYSGISFIKVSTTESNTSYTILFDGDGGSIFRFRGLIRESFSITNIKIIEITDDTNLPRISYENFSYDGSGNIVPDSGCGSWLWEPQSTNLLPYSEDYTQWNVKTRILLTNDIATSPSGDLNASKIIPTSTSGTHQLRQNLTSVTGDYTYSIFAKKGEYKNILLWDDVLSGGVGVNLEDLSVFRDQNNQGYKIVDFGNDWIRISLTHSFSNQTMTPSIYVYDNSATPQIVFAGNDTDGLFLYGFQVEEQSYATSYIPTDGTTVTRNQDVCTNGGSVSTINSTEGVLYFEGNVLANTSTFEVISLSDGSTSNILALVYRNIANQFTGVVKSGGSTSLSKTITLADATSTIKAAISYKLNDFKFYVNGVLIIADTTGNTPIGLNTLHFADGNGTSNKFFGKNKCLAVWKEALSDEELTLLTTI